MIIQSPRTTTAGISLLTISGWTSRCRELFYGVFCASSLHLTFIEALDSQMRIQTVMESFHSKASPSPTYINDSSTSVDDEDQMGADFVIISSLGKVTFSYLHRWASFRMSSRYFPVSLRGLL
jgi:hypothetical protein